MKKLFLTFAVTAFFSASASAATIDGTISSTSEYTWNTSEASGSYEWNSQVNSGSELGDASGGNTYNLDYLGVSIENGQFQFGLEGGDILSGREARTGNSIYLGDLAIGLTAEGSSPLSPTTDSSGFDYAVRLNSVDDNLGTAEFSLLFGGDWQMTDIYNRPDYRSETYRMDNATVLDTFTGAWTFAGSNSNNNVLEGAFDLGSLAGYDPYSGYDVNTYLTMTCVNDEAMVFGHIPAGTVSAVPEPSTYAMMMGGLGLIGFMAARRRKEQKNA